jgi:hypothetical protein
MQAQIKRHLMRRFAGSNQPAGKICFPSSARMERDLMRADSNMGQRIGDRLPFAVRSSTHLRRFDRQPRGEPERCSCIRSAAPPQQSADARRADAWGRWQSLCRCPAPADRCRSGRLLPCRALQKSPRRCSRPASRELLFHLPPQMRIERRKRLIEEQCVGLDGHASRDCYALPLPS